MKKRSYILVVLILIAALGTNTVFAYPSGTSLERQQDKIEIIELSNGTFVDADIVPSKDVKSSAKKISLLKDDKSEMLYGEKKQVDTFGNVNSVYYEAKDNTYLRMTEITLDRNPVESLKLAAERYDLSPELVKDALSQINSTGEDLIELTIYSPTIVNYEAETFDVAGVAQPKSTSYYFGYKDQRYRDEILKAQTTSGWKTVKKGRDITLSLIKSGFSYVLNLVSTGAFSSTASTLVGLYGIANTNSFTTSTSNMWQAKMTMEKSTKYTSILWSSKDYELKVVTDKGWYQFQHEVTIPGLKLQEAHRTDKKVNYKTSKYDTADREAYARRAAATNVYRDVVVSVKLKGVGF